MTNLSLSFPNLDLWSILNIWCCVWITKYALQILTFEDYISIQLKKSSYRKLTMLLVRSGLFFVIIGGFQSTIDNLFHIMDIRSENRGGNILNFGIWVVGLGFWLDIKILEFRKRKVNTNVYSH